MILTVTLNPSVDIRYTLPRLQLDSVNRVTDVSKTAGGKGLNVSRVLKQLGHEVGATGFLGGSLGRFIHSELKEMEIKDYFNDIEGTTRNCIAVIHDDGKQTELLEGGPTITATEIRSFLTSFQSATKQAELVTLSGSLPKGLGDEFYNQLLTIATEEHKHVLLDTGGKLLEKTLQHEHAPFLIKPNETEIADLLGISIENEQQLMKALVNPLFDKVEWIVVTMGSSGAIVKHLTTMYQVTIPKVKAVNPVGSGDSVMAGFAAGLSQGMMDEELIKYGVSMGILNAMEEKTGHINPSKINWCVNEIEVEQIK